MQILDWKWYNLGKPKVPSITEMVACCQNLFSNLEYDILKYGIQEMAMSTGGFKVSIEEDDEEFFVSISFVLEESSGENFSE